MQVQSNDQLIVDISKRRIRFFISKLFRWYSRYGRDFRWRKNSTSQYQRIISEVLLQRTRAEAIEAFYPKFISKYPSWKSLAHAEREDLESFLKPLGLWKRKAEAIIKLAREMARRNGRFPDCRAEIESLPGVGQYIANSVLLFCKNEAQPLLDVNMARVLERFFGPRKLADIRFDPYLQNLSRTVVVCKDPPIVNWAILDFAALVCKARKPLCANCPLATKCFYYKATGDMLGDLTANN